MKIKAVIFSLVIIAASFLPAEASILPQNMRDYLFKQTLVPSIRPDGLAVYNGSVMYLPVFPAYPADVKEVKPVKTFPAGAAMSDLPDIIVFNNNFALMKIIKIDADKSTVIHLEEYPEVIKTGAVPQDFMVPSGFVLPENLAGIIGDVSIPIEGGLKTKTFVTGRKAPLPSGRKIAAVKKNIPEKLQNKLFYVNNFQDEYIKVFSSSVSEPLYSLKTSGIIKDMKPALNGKYLLAAHKDLKSIDVIDTDKEYIIKKIELPSPPSEITVDDMRQKAYVSSTADEMLFIINLKSLRITEKIRLAGAPEKIAVSPEGSTLAYYDKKSSNIFILELNNDYSNKLIAKYPNTSKIILENDAVYLIARTEPKLRIVSYDLLMNNKTSKTKKDKLQDKINKQEEARTESENTASDIFTGLSTPDTEEDLEVSYSAGIKDAAIGSKPVDMIKYKDSIFVLCAGNGAVYKYNTADKTISEAALPSGGFFSAITQAPGSNFAVIANTADLKYAVFNLDDTAKADSVKTVPVSSYINKMIILERRK